MEEKVEVLFKGSLNNANDPVNCNYIIYWSGDTGMELVGKWEVEGKIHDGNRNNKNRYFELLEEHIAPKSNALIVVVELKRLFQGSMSLENFDTKALRLVKEAESPEGDTWNRILRDTLISGLASDKIHDKIIKEGKDVTLPRVMEIARLEVSTQRHIDGMQETAKVNYVQYGKGSKKGKLKSSRKIHNSAKQWEVVEAVEALETHSNLVERVGKFHYLQTFAGDVVKADTKKDNLVKQWKQCLGTVPQKDIMRRFAWNGKCLTHLVNVPEASTSSTSDPD